MNVGQNKYVTKAGHFGINQYIMVHRQGSEIKINLCVCVIWTRLWARQSRLWMPAVARDFYLLQNVQMGPRAHPPSYSMGTGVLSWGWGGCGVKLTTHLHLMQRLRVSGAVSSLPMCLPGKVSILFIRFQDYKSPPVEFMACRNMCHVDLILLTYSTWR
jgi:hypothetical protein